MIRSLAKTAFACAYDWSGRFFAGSRAASGSPFIVGYHRVVEDFAASSRNAIPSMLISTDTLEKHLDWIARQYEIVTLDEIGAHLESEEPFSRPVAAITFDDGYADMYINAFPLLRRKGIPAAVFVVSGLAGTSDPPVYDWLYLLLRSLSRTVTLGTFLPGLLKELNLDGAAPRKPLNGLDDPFQVLGILLDDYSYADVRRIGCAIEQRTGSVASDLAEMTALTWNMMKEMSRSGITIGSHTQSHVLLTNESPADIARELTDSRVAIESALGLPVRHFAYPNGSFNERVVAAVHAAGYCFAYGICLSRDRRYPLLTIPRRVLWEHACANAFGQFSPSIMKCQTQNVFESRKFCIHDHGVQTA